MFLEIVTPEEKVFEGEVDIVTFPGSEGSFQVMNNHAPLISTLRNGKISYRREKDKEKMQGDLDVVGGVVEVKNNSIVVLAESIFK